VWGRESGRGKSGRASLRGVVLKEREVCEGSI
jgi:hypothetical protein